MSRPYNRIFCIGLHKSGTTSLWRYFRECGLTAAHNPFWSQPPIPNAHIEAHQALADGGGHFWYPDREFGSNHEVRLLDRHYPGSRFILQVRDLRSWLVSKLIHAGWGPQTQLQPAREVSHDEWEYKSLDAVTKWLVNRSAYHRAVAAYFSSNGGDLLVVDPTSDAHCARVIGEFLDDPERGWRSRWPRRLRPRRTPTRLPHENRGAVPEPVRRHCECIADRVLREIDSAYLDERCLDRWRAR